MLDRTLKLVVVGPFAPTKSGDADYNSKLLRTLAAACPESIDITVFSHIEDNSMDDWNDLPNLHVRPRTGIGNRAAKAKSMVRLAGEIVQLRPDVVHFMSVVKPRYGGIIGPEASIELAKKLKRKGLPVVSTVHSFASDDEILNTARLHHLITPLDKGLVSYTKRLYKKVAKSVSVLRILSCGDEPQSPVRTVSRLDLHPKAWTAEIHPCDPLTLTKTKTDRAKQELQLEGKILIVALGFMERIKGFHHLLSCVDEIVDQHPEAHFVIGGNALRSDGKAYAQELTEQWQNLKHRDHVDLKIGFIGDQQWKSIFTASDIVVAAYNSTWGPSGPVHQALSSGKAVIASAVENNCDLQDQVMLVEPDNQRSLATALDLLIKNPKERERLQKAAKTYAKKHSWQAHSQELIDLYERLAA